MSSSSTDAPHRGIDAQPPAADPDSQAYRLKRLSYATLFFLAVALWLAAAAASIYFALADGN